MKTISIPQVTTAKEMANKFLSENKGEFIIIYKSEMHILGLLRYSDKQAKFSFGNLYAANMQDVELFGEFEFVSKEYAVYLALLKGFEVTVFDTYQEMLNFLNSKSRE